MLNKIILLCILLIIVPTALGNEETVGYVIKSQYYFEQGFVDVIESLGYNVEVIEDQDLPLTYLYDFEDYVFILVGDGALNFPELIPVNSMPAIMVNSYHMDDFNWSTCTGTRVSTGYLQAYVNNQDHFITQGFPETFIEYDSMGLTDDFLPKSRKSPYIRTILSSPNDHNDAIIGTVEPGTPLKYGHVSNSKGVYFGINLPDHWTSESEQLFINSILWLTTDFYQPTIMDLSIYNITNQSAEVYWETDKLSFTNFSYGTDINMDEVIEYLYASSSDTILLENLEELTTYYYQLTVCNADDFCDNSSILSFTTLDLTPPILISQQAQNITNQTANISTIINEQGYIKILYGTDPVFLIYNTATSTAGTEHEILLESLDEKTQYYYIIEMCDIYDNCINTSIFDFTTLDQTPPNAPENLLLEVVTNNNEIRVIWDAPQGETIHHYNIYISDKKRPDLHEFDFTTPFATALTTEYLDVFDAGENTRYYIVRAEDAVGNEEKNENIVGKFDIDLYEGFNLISFPLTPFNTSIEAVMHQDLLFNPVSEIQKFNGITKQFESTTFNSGEWYLGLFTDMIPLEGYFIESDYDLAFTIIGYPNKPVSLEIYEGMNLAGLTLFDGKDFEEVFNQSGLYENITQVADRDHDGDYDLATYYSTQSLWYGDLFDIESGKAYWLKTNKDFSIEVEE